MVVLTATLTPIHSESVRAGTTSVLPFQKLPAKFLLIRCHLLADAHLDTTGVSTGLVLGDVTTSMSAQPESTSVPHRNTAPISLVHTLVFNTKVHVPSVPTNAMPWPSADLPTLSEVMTVTVSTVTTETETDRMADSLPMDPMDQRDASTSMNAKLELTSVLMDRPVSTRLVNTSALLDTILFESVLLALTTVTHSLLVSQLIARPVSNVPARLDSMEPASLMASLTNKTLLDASMLMSAPLAETNALPTSSVSTLMVDTLAAETTIHSTNALHQLANLLKNAFPTHMSTLASLARMSTSALKELTLVLLSSSASTPTSELDSSAEVNQIQNKNALQVPLVRWNALLRSLLVFLP